MKKVMIAIPSMDQVPAQFAASLATLRKQEDTIVAFQISSLVYTARNELAAMAIKMGADFVLWLDSDMVFEPDTLERLIKDYNEKKGDIISGVYFRRVPPFKPVINRHFSINENSAEFDEPEDIPDEIFGIEGCGFGCVFMPVDVLFDVFGKFGKPFDPIGGNGEDLSFCWRARECGYKIVCDPHISLGHVGHQIINREYYEAYRQHGGRNDHTNRRTDEEH